MRTAEQIIQLIKDRQTAPKWVQEARENHKVLKALVYGEDFKEVLIEHIEKIEDKERAKVRLKYSLDVRDFCNRVFEQRSYSF